MNVGFVILMALLVGNAFLLSAYPRSAVIWLSTIVLLATTAGGFWWVRRLLNNIAGVTAEIDVAAGEVANAARQLASAGQALSQNAVAQSADLEQDSGASVEMASISRQTAESTRSAAAIVLEADAVATEVTGGLEDMMGAMQEIDNSSDRVSRITKVVDEIAFQTNLLALNAAVEAARAGEAGQGFAVVADEVRNLAQRAASAAGEITGLVEESSNHAKMGNEKLGRVVAALGEFLEKESRIKALIEEVSGSSELQASEMERLSTSLAKVGELTQQTAATAQQTAATGEQMNAQAVSMTELVSTLRSVAGMGHGSRKENKWQSK